MGASKFGQGEEIKDWSRRIQDIMDEMRRRSFCDYRASGSWLPTVNIYASRTAYHICVELAGLALDTVSVECPDAYHLSIRGARARPSAPGLDGPCSYELMEIDEGPFQRIIDFSEPLDRDSITLSADNGYIWIFVRKANQP